MSKKQTIISKSKQIAIHRDYRQGLKVKQITNKYQICEKSVYNVLKRCNAVKRLKTVNEKTAEAIVSAYRGSNRATVNSLASKFGFSRGTISKVLRSVGIEPRLEQYDRRRAVQHNPFSDLTNHNCLYFLGLIAGDGYIRENTVGFGCNDLDLVEQYISFIGVPLPIVEHRKDSESNTTYYVRFNNPVVVSFLNTIGITERKSLSLEISIPITYSFLRGIIDADGCIGRKGKRGFYCTVVTGSHKFQTQLFTFLVNEGFHPTRRVLTSNRHHVSLNRKKELLQLRERLYENSQYFLARKKAKFNLIDDDIV